MHTSSAVGKVPLVFQGEYTLLLSCTFSWDDLDSLSVANSSPNILSLSVESKQNMFECQSGYTSSCLRHFQNHGGICWHMVNHQPSLLLSEFASASLPPDFPDPVDGPDNADSVKTTAYKKQYGCIDNYDISHLGIV